MPAPRKCTHDAPRFSNGACSICQTARKKLRRTANPEIVNAYNRARRASDPSRENGYGKKYRKGAAFAAWYARNRPRELWKKAKQRASASGREFELTVDDVEKLLAASKRCPYTLQPYSLERMAGLKRNPWAPSLDRRDSSKGYTLDNVEVTSLWWNLAKNQWPPDIMELALLGLSAHKTKPHLTP